MKNISQYISLLLIAILFISCDEKREIKTEILEIDSSLNDKVVIDESLNIAYQIPLNWNEMPASLSEKFVARMGKNEKNSLIIYSPKSFFYDKKTSSLLRVGRIRLKDKSSFELLTLEKYIELFRKYNSKLTIKSNEINLNQFRIIELKIEKGNLISFKIIFRNRAKEIMQFDFSMTKENVAKLKPSIDASIKSIKLL